MVNVTHVTFLQNSTGMHIIKDIIYYNVEVGEGEREISFGVCVYVCVLTLLIMCTHEHRCQRCFSIHFVLSGDLNLG